MKRILIFGLSAIAVIALTLGGYETVKTVSSIQYFDIIRKVKRENGWDFIPDELTLATIETESTFDPEAVKTEYPINGSEQLFKDASVGLMQVLYSTAVWLGFKGDIWDLQDPETGIKWGTAYQVYLWKKYKDWDAVIHAYNEGPGNYDSGERVPTYYGRVVARMAKWSILLKAEGNISA